MKIIAAKSGVYLKIFRWKCIGSSIKMKKLIKCPQTYVPHAYRSIIYEGPIIKMNDSFDSLFFNATCLQRLIKQTTSINLTEPSQIINSLCHLSSSIEFLLFPFFRPLLSFFFGTCNYCLNVNYNLYVKSMAKRRTHGKGARRIF